MNELMPWDQLESGLLSRFILKPGMAEAPYRYQQCSAFTACNIGTT